MGLKLTIGNTSTPQIHSMCIPHRRICIEDSCCQMIVRHIFGRYHHSYYSWIVREARKNMLYTGNLDVAKTTSSFPTKLLSYNFLIGGLVTRQTKLIIKAFIFLMLIHEYTFCTTFICQPHLFYFNSVMIGGTFSNYVTLLLEK
jgi:hypothetical protein